MAEADPVHSMIYIYSSKRSGHEDNYNNHWRTHHGDGELGAASSRVLGAVIRRRLY